MESTLENQTKRQQTEKGEWMCEREREREKAGEGREKRE